MIKWSENGEEIDDDHDEESGDRRHRRRQQRRWQRMVFSYHGSRFEGKGWSSRHKEDGILWKLWNPWIISAWCIIMEIVACAFMVIGDSTAADKRMGFSTATMILSSITVMIPFFISFIGILDMAILCFFVPRDSDGRLTITVALLIPFARVVSWGGVFFVMWGWNQDAWEIPNRDDDAFAALLIQVSNAMSFVTIYHVKTPAVRFVASLFSYEMYMVLVPIIMASCLVYVAENTKPTASDQKENVSETESKRGAKK
jgi:hypothetical protein